jgi:hypothetical protein
MGPGPLCFEDESGQGLQYRPGFIAETGLDLTLS